MGVEVCPVHKTEFKSSRISSLHVGAMSYLSQPRGVKRKHSDDAEGTVRHPAEERKRLLDITCDKLKRLETERNPSILRQMLIHNVVRSLRRDMERDGIQMNGLSRELTTPVWPSENNQDLDDPPPGANLEIFGIGYPNHDRPPTPAVIPTQGDYGSNFSSENNFRCLMDTSDSQRATPFVRAYDRAESSGALWTEDHDRLSSLNWSSVLKSTASLDGSSDCCMSEDNTNSCSSCSSGTSLHTLMPAVTGIETYLSNSSVYSASATSSPNLNSASGNTSPGSGSSPSSSEDEIFGDVDLTLYDYDYTPLSPPNISMAPLTAEELMWSLSNDQKSLSAAEEREYLSPVRT